MKWVISLTTVSGQTGSHPMKLTIALTTNIGQTESHPIGFIPFYLHTLAFVVLNCLHVLFIVESE